MSVEVLAEVQSFFFECRIVVSGPSEYKSGADWRDIGELLAIMGPSGCGKTTLLNLLARRNPMSAVKTSGYTLIDGSDLDHDSFARISTYVEQEDTLIGALTVEETLQFSAKLSLTG